MMPNGRAAYRPFYWGALIVTLVGLAALRAWVIDERLSEATGCIYCFVEPSFGGDLPGIMLLALAAWLSTRVERFAAVMVRMLALMGLLIYLLDFSVYLQFGFRVPLAEMWAYGSNMEATMAFIRQNWPDNSWADPSGVVMALVGMGLVAALCLAWPRSPSPVGRGRLLIVLGTSLSGVAAFAALSPTGDEYIWQQNYQNLVAYNLSQSQNREYSETFAATTRIKSAKMPTCISGRNSRDSVIIVVVESLSAAHSRAYVGTDDWLPQLDAWAKRGARYANFIANGSTTDQGLIATLTGADPLPVPGRYELMKASKAAFQGVYGEMGSLPRRLRAWGYTSAFLASGDLGFIDMRGWLNSLGFNLVEGNENPIYANELRFHFNSVSDGVLYHRALRWVDQAIGIRPFLLVVNTLSTHVPFVDPETRTPSAERVFRYADRVLGEFLDGLERRGFFEHGLVLITGDHREMTPMRRGEVEQYGVSASARVPLVAIGRAVAPGTVRSELFQQADIPASVATLVGPIGCFDTRQRDLFEYTKQPAERCVLHVRGDRRERVSAFCSDGSEGEIELNGDATRVAVGNPQTLGPLVDTVNRVRIARNDHSVSR